MASMEMHAFSHDSLLDNQLPDLVEERIDTAYGKVKISIYGNRDKHPLITFHDLALDSDSNFQNFFQFVSIAEFTEKFCIYNINAPGQEVDAQTLPDTYVYPSMDGLAKIVETVVDYYELQSVIAFGVGVGANVLLRYALLNQRRLDVLILVNCMVWQILLAGLTNGHTKEQMNLRYLRGSGMNTFTVDYLMWHHFGRRLDECSPDIVRQYRVRSAIAISRDGQSGPQLNVPVLQIVGAGSPFVNDTVEVNTKLDPAHSDWRGIKVSDACGLVLDDRPEVGDREHDAVPTRTWFLPNHECCEIDEEDPGHSKWFILGNVRSRE
ncbi:Ndr family protein [Ostertagia ostertagi]